MNKEHFFKGAPGQDQAAALAAFLKKRFKLLNNWPRIVEEKSDDLY